tara:strand:+ start:844 stop:2601 length:1758 start_codon:yes stop_codon:yes gene_type:complete
MKQIIQLFIILFFLCGCSSSSSENNADSSEVVIAKGYYFEGDKKYKIYNGGIFRLNEVEDFKNLFPQSTIDGVSSRIGDQVYQGLLKLNQRSLKVENCLAQSVEENEDGTLLTFSLRDNVFFHDDPCFDGGKGRKLSAYDVKKCYDMLCEPRPDNLLFDLFDGRVKGAREYYDACLTKSENSDGVSGISVLDSLTVSIELEKPCSFFKKILTHNGCWIFPIEAYEKYGADMRVNCVGTGPFVIDKIKEGTQVRLVKNHNYWEKDENNNALPYLDVVKITFTKDKKTELANFRKGNLDMIWQLPVDEMKAVLVSLEEAKNGGNPEFQYQQKPGLSVQFYSFLNSSKVFNDINVRKAFNYAIDRETLVKYTLQGDGIPAVHGLIPDFKQYDNDEIVGFNFDVNKAQNFLSLAGFPNGKGFPAVTLQINEGGSTNVILAEAIQNMLKENLGVSISIEAVPFPTLIERFANGKADFWRTSWIADYPDPENFFKLFYGKTVPQNPNEKSITNASRFTNNDFDAYFEKALSAVDPQEQFENYKKCDEILISQAAFMPIYYAEYIRLLNLNVRAFPQNGMEYRDLSRVFFSK